MNGYASLRVGPSTRRIRGRWRLAALFATALTLVAASPVAAIDGWVGPTKISHRAGSNVSLVLGPTGTPHIAFQSEYGVHYMTRASGSWVRQRLTRSVRDQWVKIALDGAGHVHITFHRLAVCPACEFDTSMGIYHATNGSGSWAIRRITTGAGDFDASVGAHGSTVDVVFGRDGVGIVHMRRVTGIPGWTTEVAAPEADLSYRWVSARPALAVDDDGELGIAYTAPGPDAEGGDLYGGVRYATTRGAVGWTRKTVSAGNDYNVNLAIDNANMPHIVFVRDRGFARLGVVYATPDPPGWMREVMAPGGGFPYITTDEQRRPFVAWADQQGVIISRKDAGMWGHAFLTEDSGYSPDPRFAPDGTLRIAYINPGSPMGGGGVMWLRELP